ncbi:MAG: ankyrin repeat domain-containing protein [Chitinispirillaceae bacterium]|nr:ankyrin repeat domain-containing protein [Chitinispirillaceae bacterium]
MVSLRSHFTKVVFLFIIIFYWPVMCLNAIDENAATMFGAAEKGDLAAVEALIRMTPNLVKARNGDQQTALHLAAGNGHLEVVKFLLKSNADPEAKDMINFTPLHYASGFGYVEVVAVLEAAMTDNGEAEKAKKHVKSMKNSIIAAGEIAQGDRQGALQRLKADQEVSSQATSETSLVAAIEGGKLEQVKKLLDSGVDVNQRFEYEFSWLMGSNKEVTPLELAAVYNNVQIVELLLKKGADVNASDGDGYTALIVAARQGNAENLQVLLKAGAKVDARAWAGGITALNQAAVANHPDCVKVLLAAGADKSIRDNMDSSPLDRAEFWGHKEVIRLLRN